MGDFLDFRGSEIPHTVILSDPPAPQSFPMAGTFQGGLGQPGAISVFSYGVGRQKL